MIKKTGKNIVLKIKSNYCFNYKSSNHFRSFSCGYTIHKFNIMRLLKPSWVSHEGKPIFSIDIHPDGSRFATGGQGDSSASGKIAIWNMGPVRDEKFEKDEQVPKLLCQMDNHLGCVNCVRWSGNGKFLASASDDKLVMIWQSSKYGGMSSVFGSSGKIVNVEAWRSICTLRGHSGDVLDVAWSSHSAWLASCSVDNTIIIWNALKFPEQLAVLRGHTGMIKGVTWDPVGKYLASQSDDKSIRIWRTYDWQQEACITEPFRECGGTTHILRLDWSPDGQYVVSAHAMNNSGPTAQIIERTGWKTSMDFVGHRKAITCVRFNSRLLKKKLKKSVDKYFEYMCCAVASKDRSISIWATALKRPMVVLHNLFSNSILDVTWSSSGLELLCCSWDGTVAYFGFSPEEIGKPLPDEEKLALHQKLYGKSVLLSNNLSHVIIESAEMLGIQEQKEKKDKLEKQNQQQQQQKSQCVKPVVVDQSKQALMELMASGDTSSSARLLNRQIETRTKDGTRRITPIFLAPQPDLGDVPPPYVSGGPMFSSSKEVSCIVVEKKDEITSPISSSRFKDSSRSMGDLNTSGTAAVPSGTDYPASQLPGMNDGTARGGREDGVSHKKSTATASDAGQRHSSSDVDKLKLNARVRLDSLDDLPKKKDGRGRPRKDRSSDTSKYHAQPVNYPQTPTSTPMIQMAEPFCPPQSGINLPASSIHSPLSIQISGSSLPDSTIVLEVQNNVPSGSFMFHRIQSIKGSKVSWETLLVSKIIAAVGNQNLVSVACDDRSLHIYSSSSGRCLCPSIALDGAASVLRCSNTYLMVITTHGNIFVWNIQSMTCTIKNESINSLFTNNQLKLDQCSLTEQGLPTLTLSNGRTYTYKSELGCWVMLASASNVLSLCSDHHSCISSQDSPGSSGRSGPLAALTAHRHRSSNQASNLFKINSSLQSPATLSNLENQISCCLALKSASEYHFWLFTYVRYLVKEGHECKLREICDELLGPVQKMKSLTSRWEPNVLGYHKHSLLQEILQILGTNLNLQRIFSEFQEQLSSRRS